MKKLIFLSAAMLLLITASCSNDENINNPNDAKQTVHFSFTNEDFGADEPLSRTSAPTAKPQTIDLGDCEAEICVESEPAIKTRGTLTNANGHYTILAYQGGTLKGEVKGTFSGGAFTADAGAAKNFNLAPGTYDFIAFNDDVIPSGSELTVARDKAETARMGFATKVITATPQKQEVMFTMKHVGARLRTQFICQKHLPNNITSTLEATAANVIPTSVAYDPATKTYTATNGAMATISNNSPASTETKYYDSNGGKDYAYTSTSDYHYFLPTTEGSKLRLTGISAGTVFWNPIPTFNVAQLNATLTMQANKSYLVKIKLKPNYTYLMSDGSTGFFRETTFGGGTKTPIAVVLNKYSHIAVALNNASPLQTPWCDSKYSSIGTNTYGTASNVRMYDALYGSLMKRGIDETWDASYTTSAVTGEKIKGKNPDFTAFYAAANYNPGVSYTGSPALQWYLPSSSDYKEVLSNLGFGTFQIPAPGWVVRCESYNELIWSAFTQVGGESFPTGCWTSSAVGDYAAAIVVANPTSITWDHEVKYVPHFWTRAFVKY